MTAINRARQTADAVTTAEEAHSQMRRHLANARRCHDAALIYAGALAARAHREGWSATIQAWITSEQGTRRGGWESLAALTYAEQVASGAEVPPEVAPLPPVEGMAGDRWPGGIAAE